MKVDAASAYCRRRRTECRTNYRVFLRLAMTGPPIGASTLASPFTFTRVQNRVQNANFYPNKKGTRIAASPCLCWNSGGRIRTSQIEQIKNLHRNDLHDFDARFLPELKNHLPELLDLPSQIHPPELPAFSIFVYIMRDEKSTTHSAGSRHTPGAKVQCFFDLACEGNGASCRDILRLFIHTSD